MYQVLFHVPGFGWPIYTYGLLMVVGFLCATQLAKMLAKRTGINPEIIINAGLIALITGVIGARLSHVFENWSFFTDPSRTALQNIWAAMDIRSGGLTYYGGFLLAAPCTIAYMFWRKLPLRHCMDILAPALMIGLAFGRIGCFMNGCCYGAACQLPWAVHFPFESNAYVDEFAAGRINPPDQLLQDTPTGRILRSPAEIRAIPLLRQLAANQESQGLHPAQLYSSFTAFLLAALLVALLTLPHAQGSIAMLMIFLEGCSRFVLELLRAEPPVAETAWGGMSLSMIISLALVATGLIGWLIIRKIPPAEIIVPDDEDLASPAATPAMA